MTRSRNTTWCMIRTRQKSESWVQEVIRVRQLIFSGARKLPKHLFSFWCNPRGADEPWPFSADFLISSKTKGPNIAPKSFPQKGVCPFHRSHREICTRNRPVSQTKFLDDFWRAAPCSPGPLCFITDFSKPWFLGRLSFSDMKVRRRESALPRTPEWFTSRWEHERICLSGHVKSVVAGPLTGDSQTVIFKPCSENSWTKGWKWGVQSRSARNSLKSPFSNHP